MDESSDISLGRAVESPKLLMRMKFKESENLHNGMVKPDRVTCVSNLESPREVKTCVKMTKARLDE